MFGSSMTAATSSVLQNELDSCQELLQMEPDNKCKINEHNAQTVVTWLVWLDCYTDVKHQGLIELPSAAR